MNAGYKKTELGDIPQDWNVICLKDIGETIIGLTYSPSDVVKQDGVLVLRSSNIRGNRIDYNDQVLVSKKIPNKLLTKKGDILICARNGSKALIGKNALIDGNSAGNSFGAFMSVYRTEYFPFVFQLFQSDLYKNQIRGNLGATINQITSGNLEAFKFPFPPLLEQRKIAEILSTVDEKIEVIDEEISQTQELKMGMMQQLLTKGIGHTEFKESPVGKVPVSWNFVPISQVTTYVDYRGKTPPKVDEGVFLVTAKNIRNGKIDYNLSREYVPTNLYNEVMSRGLPERGDVLITTEAPLGQVACVDNPEIALAQRIIKYRGNPRMLHNPYLKHVFQGQYFQEGILRDSTGSTVKGIKGSRLHAQRVLVPPFDEQKKIAVVLDVIDEKMDSLRDKRDLYKDLKQGLMQQLLTGKLRVTINDSNESAQPRQLQPAL